MKLTKEIILNSIEDYKRVIANYSLELALEKHMDSGLCYFLVKNYGFDYNYIKEIIEPELEEDEIFYYKTIFDCLYNEEEHITCLEKRVELLEKLLKRLYE